LETIKYQNTSIFVGAPFSSLTEYLPDSVSQILLLVDENVMAQNDYDFSGFNCIVVPAGESSKNLAFVEKLLVELVNRGLDRSGFLVGVGGGVVCDITGFVASIFMRGVKFAFVPTTLLAQVDAAIGGKNGVNLGAYKNMAGTFTQPEFVLVDLFFLNTLPEREFISGMAEVIKHACIADAQYFEFLEKEKDKIRSKDQAILTQVVLQSVQIKAQIVAADVKESGLRKLLNFGHTFGHAIEKTLQIPHGEAVSYGMLIVNEIAVMDHRLTAHDAAKIKTLLHNFGLPTNSQDLKLNALEGLLFKDKKRLGHSLDLIVLNELGSATIVSKSFDEIQTYINVLR
jgi:3-dehydroquinate synthase